MDLESLAKLFLSSFLVDHFDIVRGEHDVKGERIDLWLDEKKVVPTHLVSAHEVIAYGFTPERVLQDFPIKGCAVYLHLRRRRWQVVQTGQILTVSYDLAHEGTQLTREFVAFLKAPHR